MKFEIKVPAGKKDFRIAHFKALTNSAILLDDSLEGKMRLISEITFTTINRVRMLTPPQIETIYNTIVLAFQSFTLAKEPPKEVTINKKVYTRVDPKKIGVGWHADFSKCDIEKDPVRLACLFYHPKGEVYGSEDSNQNLINPIDSRYQDFNEHFPLSLFIESTGFFLQYRIRLIRNSMAKKKGEIWGNKLLKSLRFGRGTKALSKSESIKV